MPKSACYTLTWSSSSQTYVLYEGQGEEARELVLDSPAWSLRVSQLASFAFHGLNGSYTARQEQRPRGGQYWYAYARVAGKLTKRYLGRGPELTLSRLQQGLERTLILLSAPAGYGKSTLLAQWLASAAFPFAWLALEPADNEPAHFCSSLLAALQRTDPRLAGGGRTQAAFPPQHPPRV